MFDDPVVNLLWSSEIYQRTREGILRTVQGGRAASELIDMMMVGMRTAYLAGRTDERRRLTPVVPLTTLDGMLPAPCCCRLAEGHHCGECHGRGHAAPATDAARESPARC
ncbi:hypothetical protein GCM10018962_05990 [Dactylosporangium matsuzakiense]|uniref:Uncharacterized protein n=1 Tax=Dactylosporangium matsuzakiense TaxID=53360 RepID=A0A9W6KEK1_9ACTN|nr:hypothetical protein GCM10017581_003500 [Dactylosporangium matsuzakiense]